MRAECLDNRSADSKMRHNQSAGQFRSGTFVCLDRWSDGRTRISRPSAQINIPSRHTYPIVADKNAMECPCTLFEYTRPPPASFSPLSQVILVYVRAYLSTRACRKVVVYARNVTVVQFQEPRCKSVHSCDERLQVTNWVIPTIKQAIYECDSQ